jgi:hypothetical protein
MRLILGAAGFGGAGFGGGERGGGERDTGRDQAAPATLGGVELGRALLGLFGGGRGGLANPTRGSSARTVDGVLRRRACGSGLRAGFLLSLLTGAAAALSDGVQGRRDCAADALAGGGRMLSNCLDGRARQPVGLPTCCCSARCALLLRPIACPLVMAPFAGIQRRGP